MKRIIALTLCTLFLFALCACEKPEELESSIAESSLASTPSTEDSSLDAESSESVAESEAASEDESDISSEPVSESESNTENDVESDTSKEDEGFKITCTDASDELLADEDKYFIYSSGSEYSRSIAIKTNEKITNVRVFGIEPEYFEDSEWAEIITELYYMLDELTPDKCLVLEQELSDKFNTFGISFINPDGITEYYTIGESARDGSILFEKTDDLQESVDALYEYAKLESTRDIGDLQPETKEIIIIDGKYYQSYVSASHDARYVFLSCAEFEMSASWDWLHIGTKDDYDLKNAGYESAS